MPGLKITCFLLLFVSFHLYDVYCDDELESDEEASNSNDGEDDVLVLNNDNFDEALEKNPILLVEFYAPWCGHCKQLAPEYAAAASELLKNDPPVALAKVDATVHNELAQRFEVQGYPTLHFFKDGKDYGYDGPRDRDGIVQYMKERAAPDWEPEPDAVITLTEDDFDEVVDNEKLMLVEFYAPWCGHCKRLAPTYEKAAKMLKKEDPPILLAKVDATVSTNLAKKFEISGYPTLKIFRNGRPTDYNGEYRSEYDIISHMKNQVGDGAKEIQNAKILKNYMSEDDITVVGFFESKDSALFAAYKDFSDDSRDDYKFAVVFDEATRVSFKVNPNSVVVFHAERFHTKYEPKRHVLQVTKSTGSQEIRNFIDENSLPLVGHYTPPLKVRYDKKKPVCIVFYTVDFSFAGRSATQFWRNKVAAVAKKFPDVKFAVADDDSSADVLSTFGLADSGEEMNIGIIGPDNKKYGMELSDDFDDFEEFIEKFQKGKLTPFLKSQRPPSKQTGSVTVVVAKSFKDIVLDPKKDVLIELYAPWCGHCKKLAPIYESLAKKLKKEKNLVIAKMDATANDVPDNFSAEGFPTIYFASAKNKESPLKYEGGRTEDDFKKFLKEKATVSFGKGSKEEL